MRKLIFAFRNFANAHKKTVPFSDMKYDGSRAAGGHRVTIKLLLYVQSTEVTLNP